MAASNGEDDVKAPNLFERAKEEVEAIMHSEKTHHKETHGMSSDIDEDTPINKVKGPSVFARAKEEIEALVETIHPKREPDRKQNTEREGGFWESLGRTFEKVCTPFNRKRE